MQAATRFRNQNKNTHAQFCWLTLTAVIRIATRKQQFHDVSQIVVRQLDIFAKDKVEAWRLDAGLKLVCCTSCIFFVRKMA
jgi:hypothetical protein